MDSRRLDTVQVLSEDLSNTKYNEGAFESLFFCPQNKAEIMHRTKPFESALFGMMPTITLLTKMPSMRRFAPVFLLLSLAATFLIYQRGLSGAFVFDDGPNIIHNSGIAINDLKLPTLKQAAFSGSSGPMMRPISMLSFAANYYATGLNPYYFKLTNLVIHLFNGIGVFALTALLLSFYRKRFEPDLPVTYAQWLSLAVATAWLLHPLNLTSVLYIVQRMTSLSAFFSIWGLVVFVWGRARLHEGKNGVLPILASMLLFTPLAALSKENGLLLPVFMLVAEAALFIFYAEKPAARRFLIGFYVLFLAIPAAAAIIYGAMHLDDLLAGYRTRGFTLPERVMTEARVVWFYIWQILLPSNAQMGLHHDDIAVSRGLFQPVSTALSLAGVARSRDGKGWKVTGTIVQTPPLFELEVPLQLQSAAAEVKELVAVRRERTPFSIASPEKPERLFLDPQADIFRILTPAEIPATVNSIKGSSRVLGVVTADCRAGRATFRAFLASLSQGEAPLLEEAELDRGRTSGSDLVFCGVPRDRSLLPRLPAGIELGQGGFSLDGVSFSGSDALLMLVLQREGGRVAALFQPLSQPAAEQYAPKIMHYGKYGYLAFAGGSNRRKGVAAATDASVAVELDQGAHP